MPSVMACEFPLVADFRESSVITCNNWIPIDDSLMFTSDEFISIFEFDPELFGLLTVALLVNFITGFVLGLVVKNLNKT